MTDFANPEPLTAEQKVKRDRWNRPIIMQPDGSERAYTRMTTLVKCVDDTHNLEQWKIRNAMLGMVERPDLLLAVRAHRDDKKELNRLGEEAQEAAKAHSKATIGTALHKLTESIDRGEELDGIPLDWAPDLAAYARETKQLKMIAAEQFRVLDELEVAGTADRLIEYEGEVYVGDIKSGSIDFALTIAMQIAGYANAVPYDPATGQRLVDARPVNRERGIIIHLPQGTGTCALYWVDLTLGMRGLRIAKDVHTLRKAKDIVTPLAQPQIVLADPLIEAIATAPTVEALGDLWRANVAVWTEEHTRFAATRKAQLA